MNWEQTIEYIREQPKFRGLVTDAYFEKNLSKNVKKFISESEFKKTLQIIRKYSKENTLKILDIGAGNGISTIGFALQRWQVDAVEPDPSNTVGAGAIRQLIDSYNLNGFVNVHECCAEDVNFPSNHFDIVYARQSMHHAYNLDKFVQEAARTLKPNGLFLTVRDHVIYNEEDKALFLNSHPLHQFYGGENAYLESEYLKAMEAADLTDIEILKHFDSEINYFPLKKSTYKYSLIKKEIYSFLGQVKFSSLPYIGEIIMKRLSYLENFGDEKFIPGRMYSFIAKKKK